MKHEKDIKSWTLEFAISMVRLSTELKQANVDFDVITQIRKSATSVGANVREAKSSVSRKELIRFYSIALKAANETDFGSRLLQRSTTLIRRRSVNAGIILKQIEKVIGKIIVKLKEPSLVVSA